MSDLSSRIRGEYPELSSEQIEGIVRFHCFLAQENEKQNLTRLISADDFFEGHLVDVMELLHLDWLSGTVMDLGSGCGVPGLLASIISGRPWILCEAEGNKARFLSEAAAFCGISDRIRVVNQRAEAFLANERADTVVARAVGPVLRMMNWIGTCSTWNTLVLFKGPNWATEWEELEKSKFRGKLRVSGERNYTVGADKKSRILLKLDRVPRGTEKILSAREKILAHSDDHG